MNLCMEVRRAQYSAYLGNGKLITTKHFMDYYKLSVEVISNSKFNYYFNKFGLKSQNQLFWYTNILLVVSIIWIIKKNLI